MKKKYMWKKRALIMGMVLLTSLTGTNMMKVQAENSPAGEILNTFLQEAYTVGNVYTVRQDGLGDFVTIQSGVEAAQDGDTLVIYPGIYAESIMIKDKTVNLCGIDPASCIIQFERPSYRYVPLSLSSGRVMNLTIYGKQPAGEEIEITDSIMNANLSDRESIQIDEFPGYTVHVESDASFGKSLYFINCRLISDYNYVIGMGLRGDFKASFIGCELTGRGNAGCVYLHDADNEVMGGRADVLFQDCILKSYLCPYVMSLHSLHESNETYFTFKNVHVSTVAYERKGIYNDYNLFQGYDVDTILNQQKNGTLRSTGYVSYMAGNIVHDLSITETMKYLQQARSKDKNLMFQVPLQEGITYIKMTETDSATRAKEALPQTKEKQREIFNVWNSTGLPGDGWCGLSHMYLTEDSTGNTLTEMNYTPPQY